MTVKKLHPDDPCPVCQGRMMMRVPLRYPVQAVALARDLPPELPPSSAEYPCPECAIPDRAHVLKFSERVPGAMPTEAAIAGMGRSLWRKLCDDGLVTVVCGDLKRDDLSYGREYRTVTATAVVMHPDRAVPLAAKIAEQQNEAITELAQAIASQVGNWGSDYGAAMISKDIIYRLIGDAQLKVRK